MKFSVGYKYLQLDPSATMSGEEDNVNLQTQDSAVALNAPTKYPIYNIVPRS